MDGLACDLLLGVFEICLSLLGLSNHPAKYLLAVLALMSVEYWVEYDLRALNGNLVYLASLLLALSFSYKDKPHAAGFFLAVSIVLKLYSVVFLPYFLLKQRYKLCFAATIWIGVFFLGLPIAYFGLKDAVGFTISWVQVVLSSRGNMNFPWEVPSYLMSLHKTLLILLTERGGKGVDNVMNLTEERVQLITQGIQFLWLILVASYFWSSYRRPSRMNPGPAMIMDAGVLTVLTLPLSPALQPHHGVVMLIPAILLVAVVVDSKQPVSMRWSSLALSLTCGLTAQFGPSGSIRGVGMLLCIGLFLCGLIFLRAKGFGSLPVQGCEPIRSS